jgi:hypothetical protein
MDLSVTAEEYVQAFQRDWPAQAEISALRLANALQAHRIAELEMATDNGHSHPHGEQE